jgi:hypothetical protein
MVEGVIMVLGRRLSEMLEKRLECSEKFFT